MYAVVNDWNSEMYSTKRIDNYLIHFVNNLLAEVFTIIFTIINTIHVAWTII